MFLLEAGIFSIVQDRSLRLRRDHRSDVKAGDVKDDKVAPESNPVQTTFVKTRSKRVFARSGHPFVCSGRKTPKLTRRSRRLKKKKLQKQK